MCIVQVVIDFPLRVLDLKPIHNISKIFNMTDMGSPCIRKYDKLTVSSLALAARATRDYMRCQERDWQALSHFSTSLTQQETAFHRSTVARRSRSRSARGGRSRRRRRYIGAQLLIDVTVKPRAEGSQQETAIHRSTVAHRSRSKSARGEGGGSQQAPETARYGVCGAKSSTIHWHISQHAGSAPGLA